MQTNIGCSYNQLKLEIGSIEEDRQLTTLAFWAVLKSFPFLKRVVKSVTIIVTLFLRFLMQNPRAGSKYSISRILQ